MAKSAKGSGTIRKKTVARAGKEYTYWEARYTEGWDTGTGKQIQRSVTGKTQKEVAQKLKAATAAIDAGTYTAPNKMTVGEWLDIWSAEYLGNVKPYTVVAYKGIIKNHLKPAIGAVKLECLTTNTIQKFYNSLSSAEPPLSAKSIKNVHGILHKALHQAIMLGYIRFNPTDACVLPRIAKKEIMPLDEIQTAAFLKAIKGHRFETLFTVDLFTGLREGELLGLTWDCVDLERGAIIMNKQLQREKKKQGKYVFAPLKNDKSRVVTLAPWVVQLLSNHKIKQDEKRKSMGEMWEESGFVFTDDLGQHLAIHTVYKDFKAIAAAIGSPSTRFHDLRHSYAVAAIRAGDDIKTVQGNLGHATASFTLDVYGHVTDQMKQQSAARMENYIQSILNPERENARENTTKK